jgi:hypothetical protein
MGELINNKTSAYLCNDRRRVHTNYPKIFSQPNSDHIQALLCTGICNNQAVDKDLSFSNNAFLSIQPLLLHQQ